MAHPERKGGYRGFLPPESERAKKKKRKGQSDSAETTLNITSGPSRPDQYVRPYLNMEIANP